MNKKTLYVLAACLLIALAALALVKGTGQPQLVYGLNLLKNADFETITGEMLPEGWLPDAYQRLPGTSLFETAPGRSGQGIQVSNIEHNDARFMQEVEVHPNTLYELSGYIKAHTSEGLGANVSIADVFTQWPSLSDTEDGWQQLKVYGRTGPGQKTLTVYARLGGYSAESLGTAAFDDLSLTAVKEVPADAVVSSWEGWSAGQNLAQEKEEAQAAPAWPWLILTALVWCLAALRLAKWAHSREEGNLPGTEKRTDVALMTLLLAAFVTRLLTAMLVPGYGVDVGCFTAWSDRMYRVGPADFYITEQHSDYPPGYMLALWPVGLIGSLLGTGATELMIKIPSILADLAAIILLYRYARKISGGPAALALAAVYAFNPLTYAGGAAWGQVDSLPTALILLTVLLAFEGRWRTALPVYTLSVLMKPQSLMFGPLGLAALVLWLLKENDRKKWKEALIGAGLSLIVALVVILPFSVHQKDANWLTELYAGTMTYYNYATVNATNLYFLFGLNWQTTGADAPFLLRILGAASLIAPVLMYVHLKKDAIAAKERALLCVSLLPALAALLPFSLALTGTLLMVCGFLVVLIRFISQGKVENLPLLGGVMLSLFCALGVMMHERYLFPAAALLMLAYLYRRDKSILLLMIALSALTFLNVGIALDRGVRIGGVPGHLSAPAFGIVSESGWLEYLLSAAQVLTASCALFVGLSQSRLESPATPFTFKTAAENPENQKAKGRQALLNRMLTPRHLPRTDAKDWLLILLVTAAYGVLALSNLGATKAPQTPWVSADAENEAVFDLGSLRKFQLLYYPGIEQRQQSEFEVSVSADMENWISYPAQMDPGNCFQWIYVKEGLRSGAPLAMEGRYLRIYAPSRMTTIMEIMARDAVTDETIPLALVSGKGETLMDEQDSLDGDPSWYNSAYFDEIYHARTGYEHANAMRGLEPNNTYEISHPPLGKVLIAFSTMVFGMTPYGWRFPGALAGVLMLPGMYLLGKLLTKKRFFAFLAAALLALDGMHFAQTRIATIDSFVTLFIIWSYYFMFRYALDESMGRNRKSDLINLGLSGLFMGLGIASKWSGVYAGLGLAVIFFWTLWRRVNAYVAAGEALEGGFDGEKAEPLRIFRKEGPRRLLVTLGWCVLVFILIPACIYYVSFLPWFMRTPGGLTVQKVMDANATMLAYHAQPGFGAEHPYASPWYEWPLIMKPFYFYSGRRIGDTGSTIMSFGNPAVWWGGFAAVLILLALWVKRGLVDRSGKGNRRIFLIIVSYLAQYAPWMLVPRGTYMYHYFPSVPFIILAAVLALYYLYLKNRRAGLIVSGVYLALALALFIGFFPYYSGIRVSAAWLNAMRWFPRIYY